MSNLKQISAFVAVCESGSFSRAAEREFATQSGMSQHVRALEEVLGSRLLERTRDGVVTTAAGQHYYEHCVQALRALSSGEEAVRALDGAIAGDLRAGLMPAFTRAALAPALERFASRYPGVDVQVTEAYSGALTNAVLQDELDFALVPAGQVPAGIKSSLLSRDTEMLVSAAGCGLAPMHEVVLADLPPLKLILPGEGNVRRDRLLQYLDTNGVKIDAMMSMDAMLGTLEFVARSDWVTILPGLILIADRNGQARVINPISSPGMSAEFVVIEPSRRKMSRPAALFLDEIRAEVRSIEQAWQSSGISTAG